MHDSNSPAYPLAKAFLSEASSGLFILTGPRGAGKTAFCSQLADLARQEGLLIGGLICPAVFKAGEKEGIDQVDLHSGQCRHLGVRSPAGSCSPASNTNAIGRWQMDERVIQWGNEIFAALRDRDLTIIDELGPLEFEVGAGYQEALRLLDEGRYCTALVVVRPAFLQTALSRWPQAQVIELQGETV